MQVGKRRAERSPFGCKNDFESAIAPREGLIRRQSVCSSSGASCLLGRPHPSAERLQFIRCFPYVWTASSVGRAPAVHPVPSACLGGLIRRQSACGSSGASCLFGRPHPSSERLQFIRCLPLVQRPHPSSARKSGLMPPSPKGKAIPIVCQVNPDKTSPVPFPKGKAAGIVYLVLSEQTTEFAFPFGEGGAGVGDTGDG